MESEDGEIHPLPLDAFPERKFFEFRIEKAEVTNQTILVIKDFAERRRSKTRATSGATSQGSFHRLGSN